MTESKILFVLFHFRLSQNWTETVFLTNQEDGPIYKVSDADETIVRLHFVKFETKFIETCLDFIQDQAKDTRPVPERCIKVTGGGGYKYTDLISEKLSVRWVNEKNENILSWVL